MTTRIFAWMLCGSLASAGAMDFDELRHRAAQQASTPYRPQDQTIPEALAKWDYSQYTAVHYRKDTGVWRAADSKFYLQGFLRAYLFPDGCGSICWKEASRGNTASRPGIFRWTNRRSRI